MERQYIFSSEMLKAFSVSNSINTLSSLVFSIALEVLMWQGKNGIRIGTKGNKLSFTNDRDNTEGYTSYGIAQITKRFSTLLLPVNIK